MNPTSFSRFEWENNWYTKQNFTIFINKLDEKKVKTQRKIKKILYNTRKQYPNTSNESNEEEQFIMCFIVKINQEFMASRDLFEVSYSK